LPPNIIISDKVVPFDAQQHSKAPLVKREIYIAFMVLGQYKQLPRSRQLCTGPTDTHALPTVAEPTVACRSENVECIYQVPSSNTCKYREHIFHLNNQSAYDGSYLGKFHNSELASKQF